MGEACRADALIGVLLKNAPLLLLFLLRPPLFASYICCGFGFSTGLGRMEFSASCLGVGGRAQDDVFVAQSRTCHVGSLGHCVLPSVAVQANRDIWQP